MACLTPDGRGLEFDCWRPQIFVPEELPVLLCDLSHQELTVELKLRLEQFFHCGQMRGGCGVLVLQGLTSIGAWQTKEDVRTHNMKAKLKSFALDLTYFQSILEFKCSSEKWLLDFLLTIDK